MARRAWLLALLLVAACDRHVPVAQVPVAPQSPAPYQQPPSPPDSEEAPTERALTSGELAMLRPVFGASIDYDKVRVVHGKYTRFQDDQTYMTPDDHMYAPGDLYEDDFSRTDPYLQATMVHEMTHVWQHQSGMDMISAGLITFKAFDGDYGAAYPYSLVAGRDLTEYNVEQQATIVEDWFLIATYAAWPTQLMNPPADNADRDALYKGILAAFVADPTYAKKLGPDELLRRHADATGVSLDE
jgi:hypothetical protein